MRIPTLAMKFSGVSKVIDGMLQVELTTQERDMLVRGLRYVRSAIKLELREPYREDECRRAGLLDEIQNLSQRLESTDPLGVRV